MRSEQEHNDWLESFLQEQADKHRLYPSDQLWQNIQEDIHGKKTWPALTIVALAMLIGLTVSTLLNNHPDKQQYILNLQDNQTAIDLTDPEQQKANLIRNNRYITRFSGSDLTAQTLAIIQEHNELESLLQQTAPIKQQHVIMEQQAISSAASFKNIQIQDLKPYVSVIGNNLIQEEMAEADNTAEEEASSLNEEAVNFRKAARKNHQQEHGADDYLNEQGYTENKRISKKGKPSKFSYQFWASPSTGFRNLDESGARMLNGAANIANSNNAGSAMFSSGSNTPTIRHRPGLGLELGLAFMYQVKPALRIKAGVQFNLRHYLIEAFQSAYQQSDVLLVNDNRTIQTVPVFTRFNNKSGFNETVIDNKLYQLAFPVGLQLDLLKGKRIGLLLDASIQPTLNLNSKLYTLTTDLNHYFDGSNLIRRWNMNSTIGLNVSFTTSNQVSWQIGPQFRYQHLPTYTNAYPIRENFKDFGVKMGMLIPIRH